MQTSAYRRLALAGLHLAKRAGLILFWACCGIFAFVAWMSWSDGAQIGSAIFAGALLIADALPGMVVIVNGKTLSNREG